jgi:CelD/BcsL family acetyltransferase involved in cellulose biosynthesis
MALAATPNVPSRYLELLDAREPRAEATWRDLETRAFRSPYFLSWGWVETWLAALPEERRPQLAVVHEDGSPAAAFFLGRRRERRHLVMNSEVYYFNTTGVPRHDEVCIEHNGLVALPGADRSLAGLLEVLPGSWDEVVLPAVDRYAFDDIGASVASTRLAKYLVRVERETVAPFVDLDAVRAANGDYLALLGTNTRTQLRRARRVVGDLTVEIASDDRHALDIYGELLRLHARRWHERGQHGAFADPWFERFHRRLITTRIAHGEIQLARVRAGERTIGCLYNFVYDGRVLFYQCGLAQFEEPHVKPGYLCHAAVIDHNARAGHAVYDLLGGGPYKERLATSATRLVWLRVQRPLARFSIEANLRKWKQVLAQVPRRLALRPA